MPNGSEEHHAQLVAPVGVEDGLVLLGLGLGDVGFGLGEVGLELGEVGRADGDELGLCLGFGLCLCLCLGAGCRDLCVRDASS